MKIGLNCQHLLIENPAGPERFTINLYHHLAKLDNANEYVLYFNAQPTPEFIEELIKNKENFSIKVVQKGFLWTQIRLAFELLLHPVDVFFTPVHTFPFLRHPQTKFVAMIHGLEYQTNKEIDNSFKKLLHPWELSWVVKNADKLIVPSKATKTAVVNKNWLSDSTKILVINEGVSNEFHEYAPKLIEDVLAKYNIEYKKYLLFVSTIQPRKNIINLIQAFSKIDNGNMKLVLVGKLGWAYDDILSAPKNLGVSDCVKFLNWVPQDELPLLFSGAAGYTNISYDEGFGLTLLEAMASNIPAVVSDIPAHKEVGANSVMLVDPRDINNISKNLAVIINGQYPAAMLNLAKSRSMKFTWDETAKRFIEVFASMRIR